MKDVFTTGDRDSQTLNPSKERSEKRVYAGGKGTSVPTAGTKSVGECARPASE